MKTLSIYFVALLLSWNAQAAVTVIGNTSGGLRIGVPQTNSVNVTGMVSWWTFDGGVTPWTSATAATTRDSVGANTGTLTSMSQVASPTAGRYGQGLYFDGVNDYVTVPAAASINNIETSAGMSVSLWVKNGANQSKVIISKGNDANNGRWIIQTAATSYPTRVTFNKDCSDVADYNVVWLNALRTNSSWQHLVIVWTGNTTAGSSSLYIDGVLFSVSSETVGGTKRDDSGNALTIGGTAAGLFFNGGIDDVRLYNRQLSAAEVGSLYNAGVLNFGSVGRSQITNTVDVWCPFEGGTLGAHPTAGGLNSETYLATGSSMTWSISGSYGDSFTYAANSQQTLFNKVKVGSTVYTDTGSKGLEFDFSVAALAQLLGTYAADHDTITVGFMATHLLDTATDSGNYDLMVCEDSGAQEFAIAQVKPVAGWQLHNKSQEGVSGGTVFVSSGTSVWITMRIVRNSAVVLSVINPNTGTVIGTSTLNYANYTQNIFMLGSDSHGETPAKKWRIDNLMIAYSDIYPIIP